MNLVLYGLPGSGKSTTARRVGRLLGREVVDTDREVELASGRSIAAIFAEDGEAAFRTLERAAVAAAAAGERRVIAVGGGALADEANAAALQGNGRLVLLDAPLDTLLARLRRSRTPRPLLLGADPEAALRALADARLPHYRLLADLTVDTAPGPAAVATVIADWARSQPELDAVRA